MPIVRGFDSSKTTLVSTIKHLTGFDELVHEDASHVAKPKNEEQMTQQKSLPVPLNLTLPDLDWDDAPIIDPMTPRNFFDTPRQEESRFDFSGRVLMDESEEAEMKPLTETILGAEIEFKLRTR